VLVNNAGVAIHRDSGDFDEARWRRIMSLNLDAVWQRRMPTKANNEMERNINLHLQYTGQPNI